MSKIYTFENEMGDQKIITGNIYWECELAWNEVDNTNSNYSIMPLDTWCNVNSYKYEMFGKWKLNRII
jgi:hypothetical protein